MSLDEGKAKLLALSLHTPYHEMRSLKTSFDKSVTACRHTLQTEDTRIGDVRPLLPPACLAEEIPLTDKARQTVLAARTAVQNVIVGTDDR